jgi:amino acid adenylation domain-containing protein
MAPGEPAYNLLIGARLEGPLDAAGGGASPAPAAAGAGRRLASAPLSGRAALAAAWAEVVRRHEVLRTTFELRGEGRQEPVQRVAPAPPDVPPLPLVDLAALPAGRTAAELQEQAVRLGRGAFDLARGPLVRVALVRSGPARHDLVIAMHHIVCDEWSLRRLLHEISTLHRAFTAGRPSPLGALEVQYGDWAAWQRRRHASGRLDAQLELWRRRLAPPPPPLELPADRMRPAVLRYRGARRPLAFSLSAATLGSLLAAGRGSGATPFMVLLAAFAGLLARLSGQEDFALGTPITGRGRIEVEPLLGCFLNTLAVRLEPDRAAPFPALVARVRERALEAFALREVPFERLVDELHPRRGLDRAPFFQVLFVLLHWPEAAVELPGLRLQPWDADLGTAKFDLTLSLLLGGAAGGGLRGTVEYSTDLFDAATVDRLTRHLGALLESAAAQPGRPLGALALLAAGERHQVVHEWGTGREPRAGAMPRLLDLFAARAAAHPERLAILAGSGTGSAGSWTYGELRQRVESLAAWLRHATACVGPEVVVGVCVGRGLELPLSLLAVLAAGGAYLPIDPSLPAARIAAMLADAGVTVLVATRTLFPGGAGPEALRRIVWLDARGGWEDQVRTAAGEWEIRTAAAAGEWETPTAAAAGDGETRGRTAADPEQLAYAIFTSGSTGRPKGVGLPHRVLDNLISWQLAAAADTAAATTLQFAAPGFDVSLQEILATLCGGGTLVLAGEEERLDPERLLAHLISRRIERLFLPFVALQGLADLAGRAQPAAAELPPLRTVITAGERLQVTPQIAALWRRLDARQASTLCNQYGPSETHVVTEHVLAGDPARWPVWPPIGRPLPGTVCRVLGRFRDGFIPQPAGVAGELAVGGLAVGRGYLGRPDLTAERFVPDPCAGGAGAAGATGTAGAASPADAAGAAGTAGTAGAMGGRLYRTGDLVRCRADGAIEFLGRIDQQVKIRGFRVEPGEVEAALARLPGVGDCAVMVREDQPGDRRLAAYLVAARELAPGDLAPARLRERLRQSLPEYMIPAAFVLLQGLPRTATGKVDRRALPAPATGQGAPDGQAASEGRTAPEGRTASEGQAGKGGAQEQAGQAAPQDRETDRSTAPGGALLPRTVIERLVAEAVRAALDGAAVGVEENLFDAGAHSLTMVRAAALLSERVGRRVPVIDFFRFPTIAALARHVAGHPAAHAAAAENAAAAEDTATAASAAPGSRPGANGNVTRAERSGPPAATATGPGPAAATGAGPAPAQERLAQRAAERRQAADRRRDRRHGPPQALPASSPPPPAGADVSTGGEAPAADVHRTLEEEPPTWAGQPGSGSKA